MGVSNEGNFQNPQLPSRPAIVEAFCDILFLEWFPILKERFNEERCNHLAISIYGSLALVKDPSKEQLIDRLYEEETAMDIPKPSRSRCKKMADEIFFLRLLVDLNEK